MFGVVPRSMWERKIKPRENLIPWGVEFVVIRTGREPVVETGTGDKFSERIVRFTASPRSCSTDLPKRASRRKTWTSSSTATCISTIADGHRPPGRPDRPLSPKRSTTCRKASGNTPTKTSATGSATSRKNYPLGRKRTDDPASRRRGTRSRLQSASIPDTPATCRPSVQSGGNDMLIYRLAFRPALILDFNWVMS